MNDGYFRSSFVLFTSYADILEEMEDAAFCELMRGIFKYNKTGNAPSFMDKGAQMAFGFIKKHLDANAAKYEADLEKKRAAGKKGGEARAKKMKEAGEATLGGANQRLSNQHDYVDANADCYSNDEGEEKQKPPSSKRRFGEFANVELSDEEFETLRLEFPESYSEKIDRLSVYMEGHGKTYKNHFAMIRKWAREDAAKAKEGFHPEYSTETILIENEGAEDQDAPFS